MPQLEMYQIQNLLAVGIEIGMKRMAIELGAIKPFLSKSEAYKIYGRGIIDRWLAEGLIKMQKDGNASSKFRIDRMQLEIVSKASNRRSYLPVNER
jgi:hypothetical protein